MLAAGRRVPPPRWMTAPATQQLLAALAAPESPARFVGGCVRDAVLGQPSRDIDIATPLPPASVIARLEAGNIRVIPTGLAHGTVTAVIGEAHFEITTLRADVETDGRRAKVEFTDDWAGDAARRDFTINALYADADGTLYDPTGGLADLDAGRVRFVGRASVRIAEDRLRLLRFFRFHAYYGRGDPDAEGLAACSAAAAGLDNLSGERVSGELLRLLDAADPAPVVAIMARAGILEHVIGTQGNARRLAKLVALERKSGGDALRRLAALLPADAAFSEGLAARLRLSNAERDRLLALAAPAAPIDPAGDARAQRRAIYRLGGALYGDLVLLAWAGGVIADGQAMLDRATAWPAPKFPLHGADVLALGVPSGRTVGTLLSQVESWWEAGDFQASRAQCLAELARIAGAKP
jgi:poly(A) polymerase